eukprot:Skav215248  [mRNA]  locus=scaffold811:227750:228025:- [translate_table: standard]
MPRFPANAAVSQQAHHHKSLKDLLEQLGDDSIIDRQLFSMQTSLRWQKERDWQATCALRKKEEELSSLQRRCARKHEAECLGVDDPSRTER